MTGRGPGRPRLWAAALLAAVLFTLFGTPQTAAAHNALVSTSPGDGKTVAKPPTSIVLTFNEPAIKTGTKVLVIGPEGVSAVVGDPKLVDNTVEQDLAPELPAGEYEVEWRVTSADGHPINGRFTFTVRTGTVPDPSPTPSPPASTASTPASPTPASPTPTASEAPTSATTPSAQPADDSAAPRSGWWWLLAVVPVGLAAVLGWRFNRRR